MRLVHCTGIQRSIVHFSMSTQITVSSQTDVCVCVHWGCDIIWLSSPQDDGRRQTNGQNYCRIFQMSFFSAVSTTKLNLTKQNPIWWKLMSYDDAMNPLNPSLETGLIWAVYLHLQPVGDAGALEAQTQTWITSASLPGSGKVPEYFGHRQFQNRSWTQTASR